MIRRCVAVACIIVCLVAGSAFGAKADQAVGEKLLADSSPLLAWLAGLGIVVGTLIAGFKHPGRTHLD